MNVDEIVDSIPSRVIRKRKEWASKRWHRGREPTQKFNEYGLMGIT